MIKAVLLDLDDTLLLNPNHQFVPRYLDSLDAYFIKCWGEPIGDLVRQAVRQMNATRDIEQTNFDLMLSMIEQETKHSTHEIAAALQGYLAEVHPTLQDCTQSIAGVRELVEDIKRREYAVVIATNPIYPAEAVQQRLTWAGLPTELDYYAFVTHAENMHFSKPHPAYYAEILGRIGVEPDEALMVGDGFENDIRPAAQIGLHTCHIVPGDLQSFAAQLPGLKDWLPPALLPEAIKPQLQGNVGALFGLIASIKPHFWTQHPDPDEWSPIQILCHLLERENSIQRPRLERILAEENPFITEPASPLEPHDAPLCDEDGYRVAERFLQARQHTIELLRHISIEDWQRPARHSIFGHTTLLEMALFTAQHDRLHLKQLCRTLGKCH